MPARSPSLNIVLATVNLFLRFWVGLRLLPHGNFSFAHGLAGSALLPAAARQYRLVRSRAT